MVLCEAACPSWLLDNERMTLCSAVDRDQVRARNTLGGDVREISQLQSDRIRHDSVVKLPYEVKQVVQFVAEFGHQVWTQSDGGVCRLLRNSPYAF